MRLGRTRCRPLRLVPPRETTGRRLTFCFNFSSAVDVEGIRLIFCAHFWAAKIFQFHSQQTSWRLFLLTQRRLVRYQVHVGIVKDTEHYCTAVGTIWSWRHQGPARLRSLKQKLHPNGTCWLAEKNAQVCSTWSFMFLLSKVGNVYDEENIERCRSFRPAVQGLVTHGLIRFTIPSAHCQLQESGRQGKAREPVGEAHPLKLPPTSLGWNRTWDQPYMTDDCDTSQQWPGLIDGPQLGASFPSSEGKINKRNTQTSWSSTQPTLAASQ